MTHRIGVVGYSTQKFNTRKATALLVEELLKRFGSHPEGCVVVSGLTDMGIPAIAYRIATKLDMGTVGVACSKAEDYDCYPVDEKIIVGDDWGDESATFLGSIDELLKVGGGMQSETEFEAFPGPKKNLALPAFR